MYVKYNSVDNKTQFLFLMNREAALITQQFDKIRALKHSSDQTKQTLNNNNWSNNQVKVKCVTLGEQKKAIPILTDER